MPWKEATFWLGLTVFGTGLYFVIEHFVSERTSKRMFWLALGVGLIGASAIGYSMYSYYVPTVAKLPVWLYLLMLTWGLIGWDYYERTHVVKKLTLHSAVYGTGPLAPTPGELCDKTWTMVGDLARLLLENDQTVEPEQNVDMSVTGLETRTIDSGIHDGFVKEFKTLLSEIKNDFAERGMLNVVVCNGIYPRTLGKVLDTEVIDASDIRIIITGLKQAARILEERHGLRKRESADSDKDQKVSAKSSRVGKGGLEVRAKGEVLQLVSATDRDPRITMEFDKTEKDTGVGSRLIRLRNDGGTDAYRVKVKQIVLAVGSAEFREIPQIRRDQEEPVDVTILDPGSQKPFGVDDFELLLDAEINRLSGGVDQRPLETECHITYVDHTARTFITHLVIFHDTRKGLTYAKDYKFGELVKPKN
jgi:hypothetical protein